MNKIPVGVCCVAGRSDLFFGKFKDPDSGKWRKIEGGHRFDPKFNTRAKALKLAEDWYRQMITARPVPFESTTTSWEDACDRFTKYSEQGHGAPTSKDEAVRLGTYLRGEKLFNSRPLQDHDGELATTWLLEFSNRPVKKGAPRKAPTIGNYVKILRAIYDYAESGGHFPSSKKSPAQGTFFKKELKAIKKAYRDRRTVACPSSSVTAVLRSSNLSEFRRLLFHVGALTGLRPGELHGLKMSDIQIENGVRYLDISRQFRSRRPSRPAEYGPTKTEYSDRQIPLHPELDVALTTWRETGWREHVGREPSLDDVLFPDASGNPYREEKSAPFQADLLAAGVEGTHRGETLTRSALRKTFATRALEAGVDANVRTILMGHKPVGVTSAAYERPRLGFIRDELAKMPGLLNGPVEEASFSGEPQGCSEENLPPELPSTSVSLVEADKASFQPQEVWSDVWSALDQNLFDEDVSEEEPGEALPLENTGDPSPEVLAEAKGFEPSVTCATAVFKTAAFDHSATPPRTEVARTDPRLKGD